MSMITIHGISKKQGVAIAVAAVVDAQNGINGVSPALLEEGIKAVRKRLTPEDFPETIIACDNIAMGVSVRIPGINTIGIAAESDLEIPGLEPEVPCVVGASGLLKSIGDGDIVVVDGSRGVVYVDPDPETLIHFQEIAEHRATQQRIYISSAHIPARTQAGETVYVYAQVSDETDLNLALEEGADGIVFDLRGRADQSGELYESVMCGAAGKPLMFAVDFVEEALLRAAMKCSAPGQVSALMPLTRIREELTAIEALIEAVTVEALEQDLDPPVLSFGVLARISEYENCEQTPEDDATLALDLRRSPMLDSRLAELPDKVPTWLGGRDPERVILAIGRRIETVEHVVACGARALAVEPEIVGAAKLAIRSVGAEEVID